MMSIEEYQDLWGRSFWQMPDSFLKLGLNATQREVLGVFYTYDYLAHFSERRGNMQTFMPSATWIAKHYETSRQAVFRAVKELKRLGYLRQEGEAVNGKRVNYHVDLGAISDALRERNGEPHKTPDDPSTSSDFFDFPQNVMTMDEFKNLLEEGRANEPQ